MLFDYDFCYFILLFFLPSFFKREENNKYLFQKSCFSARSRFVNPFFKCWINNLQIRKDNFICSNLNIFLYQLLLGEKSFNMILYYSFLLLPFIFGKYVCLRSCNTVKGATWNFQPGIDVEIPYVHTVQECKQRCESDPSNCQGYTYTTNGVVGYCYKFKVPILR